MKVKFKKLTPDATIPTRKHITDAGYDLTATSRKYEGMDENIVYGTGIAVEIPRGYVGLVFPRSSISKKTLVLTNSVGVIDSGYRGEIMVKFKDISRTYNCVPYDIGERVAQLIIIPIPDIEFEEVDELQSSDRGADAYGSTGK